MAAEPNARSRAHGFHWRHGTPDLTGAERRDLEALRDACTELLTSADMG